MLAGAISRTISQLFSPPFRSVLWKSIGLTLAMLVGLWFLVQAASSVFLLPMLSNYSWLATALYMGIGRRVDSRYGVSYRPRLLRICRCIS